jgi:HAD superfamily hydrolase (TIGR01484 family)
MPGAGRLVTVSVLICSDLDGTLIPDGTADESPGARERFARCAALPEVALAYVTGRDRRLVEDAIAEFSLPRPDFVVGDVGATVYDLGTGEWKAVERWRRLLAREWGGGAVSELAASLSGLPELELQETSKQHDFKLSYYLEATSEESDVLSSVRGRLSSLEIPVRLVFSRDRTGVGLVDLLPPSAGKLSAVQFLVE